jgi:agmatinase
MTREEAINSFDENGVGVLGSLFGLPFTPENARIVLIPVPWEVTVSYGQGTAQGPEAILHASPQLDLQLPHIKDAWKLGVSMLPIPTNLLQLSYDLRNTAADYITRLEEGVEISDEESREVIDKVNAGSQKMIDWVRTEAEKILQQGKIPAVLGGDHSSPYGLLQALAEQHQEYGILQIDAHADLRIAYEGFEYSHASIMFNALKIKQVKNLVQVGIRDICQQEQQVAKNETGRVNTYFDIDLKTDLYSGKSWKDICKEIVSRLPDKVYISFDIDGLDPKLCPATGTPVPGGLEYFEAIFLISEVVESGRQIIGFDLCEVAPGEGEWNGNVGARVLYNLCAYTGLSQGMLNKI